MRFRKLAAILLLSVFLLTLFSSYAVQTFAENNAKIIVLDTNTIIQDMINEVKGNNVKNHIQYMQDLGTRFDYRPEIDTAATYIYNHFASLGLSVEYDPFTIPSYDTGFHSEPAKTVNNIIATLPGQSPYNSGYVIIVCSHYDSTSSTSYGDPTSPAPGADDNGSGTGAVMESARVFKQYAQYINATVKFVTFAGEELGLLGSEHYAEEAKERGEEIHAVINLDMIGYDPSSDYKLDVVSNDNSAWLSDLMYEVNLDYGLGLDVNNFTDGSVRASDHAPFWDQGYSAILGIEGEFNVPNYHSSTDTLSNINQDFFTRVTELGVAALASLSIPVIPVMTHLPAPYAGVGEVVRIDAGIINPDAAVSTVTLNYRDVGSDTYTSEAMQLSEGSSQDGIWSFDIPEQDSIGKLEYYIEAVDDGGGTLRSPSNELYVHSLFVKDLLQPQVEHENITEAHLKEPIPVNLTITDDVGVYNGSVFLYYNTSDSGDFRQRYINLTEGTPKNGTWTSEIPAQSKLGIVEYYVTVKDAGSNKVTIGNETDPLEIQVSDIRAPEIQHREVAMHEVNLAIPIDVEITDDDGIEEAFVYFKEVGTEFFVSKPLTFTSAANNTWSGAINAQAATGSVHYYITAKDPSGNIAVFPEDSANPFEIFIVDVNPPEIIHIPTRSAKSRQPIKITAKVTDDVGVVESKLFYKPVGADTYEEIEMSYESGEWMAEIPAQSWGGTLHYYMEASDDSNNVTTADPDAYSVEVTGITLPMFVAICAAAAAAVLLLILHFKTGFLKTGKGVTGAEKPHPTQGEKGQRPERRECPVCGAVVEEGSTVCPVCLEELK